VQEIIDWIREANDQVEYGTIVITITKHQGKIVAIERQVTDKVKKGLDKKREPGGIMYPGGE